MIPCQRMRQGEKKLGRKKKCKDAFAMLDCLAMLWLLHRSGVLELLLKAKIEKKETQDNGS